MRTGSTGGAGREEEGTRTKKGRLSGRLAGFYYFETLISQLISDTNVRELCTIKPLKMMMGDVTKGSHRYSRVQLGFKPPWFYTWNNAEGPRKH